MAMESAAVHAHRGGPRRKWAVTKPSALVALASCCAAASAQSVLFTSMDPTNGVSQNIFYPVSTQGLSRLGFAFSPQAGGRVTQITVGLYRGPNTAQATLELYADNGGSPGAMLGAWPASVPAYNGAPVPPAAPVPIAGGPTLQAGATYYLVVPVQPGQYLYWFLPSSGQSTPTTTQVWIAPGGGPWQIETQPYAAFALAGEPACYANCDGSTAAPILNVNDFICFQSQFAAGDTYANCDASTTAPVLNVNDFICFQSKFASGCP